MTVVESLRRSVGVLLLSAVLGHPGGAWAGSGPEPGGNGARPPHGPPPQAAIDACAKLSEGAACQFTGRRGESIGGTCHTPPQQSALACVPAHPPMPAPSKDDDGPSRGY